MRVSFFFALIVCVVMLATAISALGFDDVETLRRSAHASETKSIKILPRVHSTEAREHEERGLTNENGVVDKLADVAGAFTRPFTSSKTLHPVPEDQLEPLLAGYQTARHVKFPRGPDANHKDPVDFWFETNEYRQAFTLERFKAAPPRAYTNLLEKYGQSKTPIVIYKMKNVPGKKNLDWKKLEEAQFIAWFRRKTFPEDAMKKDPSITETEEDGAIAKAITDDYKKFIVAQLKEVREHQLPLTPYADLLEMDSVFAESVNEKAYELMRQRYLDRLSNRYKPLLKKYGNIVVQRYVYALKASSDLNARSLGRQLENEQFTHWFFHTVAPRRARQQAMDAAESDEDVSIAKAIMDDYENFVRRKVKEVRGYLILQTKKPDEGSVFAQFDHAKYERRLEAQLYLLRDSITAYTALVDEYGNVATQRIIHNHITSGDPLEQQKGFNLEKVQFLCWVSYMVDPHRARQQVLDAAESAEHINIGEAVMGRYEDFVGSELDTNKHPEKGWFLW